MQEPVYVIGSIEGTTKRCHDEAVVADVHALGEECLLRPAIVLARDFDILVGVDDRAHGRERFEVFVAHSTHQEAVLRRDHRGSGTVAPGVLGEEDADGVAGVTTAKNTSIGLHAESLPDSPCVTKKPTDMAWSRHITT